MLKANDVIYFKGNCYVLVQEISVNVINDPTPHMGYTLTDLRGKTLNMIIVDTDYNDVVVLVRR